MSMIVGIKKWVVWTTSVIVFVSFMGALIGNCVAKWHDAPAAIAPCTERIGVISKADSVYECPENTHAGWAEISTTDVIIHCACNPQTVAETQKVNNVVPTR